MIVVRRLRHAVALVVVLFVALAAADALDWFSRPSMTREAVGLIGDGASFAMGDRNIAAVLETEEGGDVVAPPDFESEVFALAGRREVRVDEGSCVVGFACSGSSADVFAVLAGGLERKGWAQVSSGWGTHGSFVKDEGTYRWVFIACVSAGGATSVVVQYATVGEGS